MNPIGFIFHLAKRSFCLAIALYHNPTLAPKVRRANAFTPTENANAQYAMTGEDSSSPAFLLCAPCG